MAGGAARRSGSTKILPRPARARQRRRPRRDRQGLLRCGRALEAMRLAWPEMTGGFADLGGDFAFSGRPPRTPRRGASPSPTARPGAIARATLRLDGGGVATSGRDRRRFGPGRSCITSSIRNRTPAVPAPRRHRRRARPIRGRGSDRVAISERDDVRPRRRRGVAALYIPRRRDPVEVGACRSRCATESRSRHDAAGAAFPSPGSSPAPLVSSPSACSLLSIWLGLVMSTRILGPRRQKSLFGWHRTLVSDRAVDARPPRRRGLLDPVLHFGFASVLVPFSASWRPAASRPACRRLALAMLACRSGYGSGSASEAGGGRTTRASPPSASPSCTRSPRAPTWPASVGSIVAAIALGPVLWLGFARISFRAPPSPARVLRSPGMTACRRRRRPSSKRDRAALGDAGRMPSRIPASRLRRGGSTIRPAAGAAGPADRRPGASLPEPSSPDSRHLLRQREPDVSAAAVAVRGACAAAVRSRDRLDDRQPEPGTAARARLVRAAEALEGARQEAGREPGPVVADMELDVSVLRRAPRASTSPAP